MALASCAKPPLHTDPDGSEPHRGASRFVGAKRPRCPMRTAKFKPVLNDRKWVVSGWSASGERFPAR